jgi:type I restriction enzyme, S subunit
MKWKEYSLDELIHIKHGYAFKGEFFSEEPTDDILLTPGNFAIGGGFKAQKLKYYNGDFPVDYILDENDVIVTMTDLSKEADTLGFSAKVPAWYGKRFLHNQRIGLVKLKTDDFHQDYLYWLMRTFSYQRFVANGATGATVKHTSPTKICQYKFTAPVDKNTQRKIASILSAYDDLIENNLKRIKLLEEKAFASYKLLVKSEKFKLEELYDTSSGGTPSRANAEYFTGDINWFKSKELADSILLDSEEKITEQALDKSSAKLFPAGSVIMAMYGATIGKLGLLSQPSTTNQACCAIIQKDEINSNYYILNWLIENREYVLSFRMGAAQENISQQVIRNLLVSIPNDSDLKIFNSEMKPIYQLIKNLHQQNTKLREARDILLPKLMNGQIEV